ncbi:MAG TPA: CDP-alcohol phosphatidyltransferase family protein [Candidatus Uhrbacteria bacterium]|nr:CDP-alcohol phosphatidyltransferase family protein [Candidatus Uhrbacteria bacterium]
MGFAIWYQNFKKNSYDFRAKYFKPFLKILARLKITPNKITISRLVFVFPLAYYFYLGNLFGVLIFYLLFWLLDLVDGALARYLGLQSDKGRFLDSVVDNFMYAVLILGFIYIEAVWAWLLAANILLEFMVQLLATIKKKINTPSDWLINVQPDAPYFKSAAHLALLAYFFGYNFLNPFFVFLNGWLAITAFYYFLIIEKKN